MTFLSTPLVLHTSNTTQSTPAKDMSIKHVLTYIFVPVVVTSFDMILKEQVKIKLDQNPLNTSQENTLSGDPKWKFNKGEYLFPISHF